MYNVALKQWIGAILFFTEITKFAKPSVHVQNVSFGPIIQQNLLEHST